MLTKKIGFIGAGNMGGAIIGGMLKANIILPENIIISDLNTSRLENFKKEYGVTVAKDSKELAKSADFIFMAIKPNVFDHVARDIVSEMRTETVIISIVAGKDIKMMEDLFGSDKRIVRTMPNTPSLANEGMTALCYNQNVTEEEKEEIQMMFDSIGKSQPLPEYLFAASTGICGSSPAYVFMFIEAMADAAVLAGMPRDQSYVFASQAVYGAAKLVMESGKHPGELKDMVCSPGGATIEAVEALEKNGFRSAVMEGVKACIEKSKEMEA